MSVTRSSLVGFLLFGIISIALPLTVFFSQKQQQTQQHAASSTVNAPVYRGVDLFGGWQGLYGGVDTFASPVTLDYFKSKELTTFRVGFAWPHLQPALNGSLDSNYLTMMDALVANAKARGQQVAFVPLPGDYNGNQVGSSSVPQSAFNDLWTKLATHYKNETAIWGYDLLNEPAMGDQWNTGIAPQAIAAIRKVDMTHPIIVPTSTGGYGYNWKFHTVGLPMQDPANSLIYEAHFYFDTPPNGQYPNVNAAPTDVNIGVERATDFVNWCNTNNQKCYAGEYGIPGGWTDGNATCTNGAPNTNPVWLTVLDNFLTYLDQNHISGTYWAGGPYGDINDVGPTCSGKDRPQMAILIKHLGTNIATFPTPIPTVKISQNPIPTLQSGAIMFSLTICPHGLGNCGDNANPTGQGNTNPKHPQRTITLTFLNAQSQPVGTAQGTVTYTSSSGNFQGTISGNIPNGQYLVKVKIDGFLPKQTPGIITVTSGQTITIPSFALVTGDINNDGQLDILDYNMLIGCFGMKQNSASCTMPPTTQSPGTDINDDGIIDGADYNLFLRELSVQKG